MPTGVLIEAGALDPVRLSCLEDDLPALRPALTMVGGTLVHDPDQRG
jgi:hypothetical protein